LANVFQEFAGLKFGKRFFAVVGIWLIVALPITYAMFSVQKNEIAELGTEFIGADGKKTVLLEPEKWIGKEFPLLSFIEPTEEQDKLKNGEWTIVLYHHDCPKCQEVINEFIEKKTENLACVEVPPYAEKVILSMHLSMQNLTRIIVNGLRILPKFLG
jgi:hypothetical protein